jgi:hypothetical protein
MDPISALVAALAAGAAASAQCAASDAVTGLYAGLKKLLAGRLSSLSNMEDDPHDEDYQQAARKEIAKKGLAEGHEIMESVAKLSSALEQEGLDKLASWGIDITGIRAAQTVAISELQASGGGIRLRDIEAKDGNVEIHGIRSARPTRKNQ